MKTFAIMLSTRVSFEVFTMIIVRMHRLVVLRYWNSPAKNGSRNLGGDYSDESVASGSLIRSTLVTEQQPTVGIAVNRQRQYVVV